MLLGGVFGGSRVLGPVLPPRDYQVQNAGRCARTRAVLPKAIPPMNDPNTPPSGAPPAAAVLTLVVLCITSSLLPAEEWSRKIICCISFLCPTLVRSAPIPFSTPPPRINVYVYITENETMENERLRVLTRLSLPQGDHVDPAKRVYSGIMDCVRKTAAEGRGAFYRGFTPCIIRAMPANGAVLTCFTATQRVLNRRGELSG